jgi:thymidylate kinase
MLITFSGLDGAGKSTLISYLKECLADRGVESTVLTMYDHVGVYATIRRVRDAIRRARGIMPRQKLSTDPDCLLEREPNAGPALIVLRSCLVKQFVYGIDLLWLLSYRLYMETICGRVLILDRYFYDSLADIAAGPGSWRYIRWFLRLTPTPRASLFIDVSPEVAFNRKQEYSVEYLKNRRDTYMKIFRLAPQPITVLENRDLDETRRRLCAVVTEAMAHS